MNPKLLPSFSGPSSGSPERTQLLSEVLLSHVQDFPLASREQEKPASVTHYRVGSRSSSPMTVFFCFEVRRDVGPLLAADPGVRK